MPGLFDSEEVILRKCDEKLTSSLKSLKKTYGVLKKPIAQDLSANTVIAYEKMQQQLSGDLVKSASALSQELKLVIAEVYKFQQGVRMRAVNICEKLSATNELLKQVEEFEKNRNVNLIPECIKNNPSLSPSNSLSPAALRMKELERAYQAEKLYQAQREAAMEKLFSRQLKEAEAAYEAEVDKMAKEARAKEREDAAKLADAEKAYLEVRKMMSAERIHKEETLKANLDRAKAAYEVEHRKITETNPPL